MLALDWRELSGPPISLPDKQGFGTRLMKRLARDLGGEGMLAYDPTGVRWNLRAKLSQICD